MKYRSTIMLLFALMSTLASAQDMKPDELRELFYRASDDKAVAQQFYDKLSAADESSPPLLLGYQGMACFMVCYHSLNPYSKIKYFIRGKNALDKAIQLEPKNVELRYLRFSVQTNAPEFLGYMRSIKDDKAFLLDALTNGKDKITDDDLRKRILDFLLQSKYVTQRERSLLEP